MWAQVNSLDVGQDVGEDVGEDVGRAAGVLSKALR